MHAQPREDAEVELEPRTASGVGARDREGDRNGSVRHWSVSLAGLLLLLLPAGVLAAPGIVILLSWDGVRYDYAERAEMPGLDRMASTGARAQRLIPVFPSNTFPNHVSLVTGTYVDTHGIVGNRFHDRERGEFNYSGDASWIEAEPIWAAAERQGVIAAVFFWVGSETPWNGIAARYRRAPFDSKIPESEKVEQILDWLDLPDEQRPRLILSWWHGADHVGHERGPADKRIVSQLERQDRELQVLLGGIDRRGLWRDTTLIVVSDHGMALANESIDVIGVLKDRDIGVKLVHAGGSAYLFLDDPARQAEALGVLNDVPGLEAFASNDLPKGLRAYHPTRSGDIIVTTRPPRAINSRSLATSTLGRLLGASRGMHGYRPDQKEMGAIFYAAGRGVPRGLELGSVRAIDVAPTIARLLDIDPPAQSEGEPIPGIRP